MGIHFLIVQILGSLLLLYLMNVSGDGNEVYYQNALWITGMGGLLAAVPMFFLYRKDCFRRREAGLVPARGAGRLSAGESLWLLIMGAALAQFVNFLMVFFTFFLESDYYDNMAMIEEGKSLGMLIFWMGIVAPVAEEMIFRWVVYLRLRDNGKMLFAVIVSAVFFGIYHGNLVQAIYASILGMFFACLLEWTGNLLSCVLLHVGANVWSLVYPEIAVRVLDTSMQIWIMPVLAVLALVLLTGLPHFFRKGRMRGGRCV